MKKILVERKTLLYTIQIVTREQCDINYIHDVFNREYTNIDKKYDLWCASFGDTYKEHTLKLEATTNPDDEPVVYVYVVYKTEETDEEFDRRQLRLEMEDFNAHLSIKRAYEAYPKEFIKFVKQLNLDKYETI
jgi:hypothetical protein